METLLEQQRRYHEERERLMDAMVQVIINPYKSHDSNECTEVGLPYLPYLIIVSIVAR
jgi:hypothetical protein